MKIQEGFKNVLSYAAGMRAWVDKNLCNGALEYSFAGDFAIADWMGGQEAVKETYERVKAEWLANYKAFTEVVIAVNMLSWAHSQLKKQGFDGRDEFISLYSDLYYQAKDDFYAKYDEDPEACKYFFQMTD